MTKYAYLFEIRSIQRFLFSTGKLRDMANGSELVDQLCREPLDAAITAVGIKPESIARPRCAGGAAYLLLPDTASAARLQNVWRILVRQLLPGIELVDTCVQGATVAEVIDNGLRALRENRNRLDAELPGSSPLTALSARTGRAAVVAERGDYLDAATDAGRRFATGCSSLVQRFSEVECHWPNNFEPDAHASCRFPLGDDRRIGLVHVDGNGLGEVLRQLTLAARCLDDESYVALYRDFSTGLEAIMARAARAATGQVLLPERTELGVMPARPLVLGGDDLTVIVRADLALPFTVAFIEAFETASVDFLKQLQQELPEASLPEQLTACAGITLMKAGQPFAQGYQLAESLCDRAKAQARLHRLEAQPIASALAFYRVQTLAGEDADQLYQRELTASALSGEAYLGLEAYRVGQVPSHFMPEWQALQDLVSVCQQQVLNVSRLRNLATLLQQDESLAIKDYQRWRELTEQQEVPHTALIEFDRHLERLLGEVDSALPFNLATDDQPRRSPLLDVLMLQSVLPLNREEYDHV